MTDKEFIKKNLSSIFGGQLFELMYNNYKIKIRIHIEQEKVSINFYKNQKKIYHIYKKFFIDAFGELSNFIEEKQFNCKPILDDLWSKIIG